jgi:hypothetical protein
MEIDAYADWAARIARISPETMPDRERLSYLGLGLAGEAGEVASLIKKLLRDGAWSQDALSDELGDVFYYLAACAPPPDIARARSWPPAAPRSSDVSPRAKPVPARHRLRESPSSWR